MSTDWQDEVRCRAAKERLARKILGVVEGADTVAIKKAFWLLAMQHHPDKCPHSAENHRRFADIVNAYEFLTKGEPKGWDPVPEDVPLEDRVAGATDNDWAYFCWWRQSFDFGADDADGPETKRKPGGEDDQ